METNIEKKNFIKKSFGEYAKLLIESSNLKKTYTTDKIVLNSMNKPMLDFFKI